MKEKDFFFRTVFENTGTGMMVIEEDTTISMVNREFENFSGYSREEVEGIMSWKELVALTEDVKAMEEYHYRRRKEPETTQRKYEFQMKTRDGSIKNILVYIDIIQSSNRSVASLMDITERKQAEEKLRGNEQKYRFLAENTLDVIWQLDKDLRFTYVSPSVEDLYGYSQQEALCLTLDQFLSPEAWNEVKKIHDEALSGKFPEKKFRLEQQHVKKNGEAIWVEIHLSLLYDNNNIFEGAIGVTRDITEHKRLMEKLRRSSRALRVLRTCNRAVIHAESEDQLLQRVCQAIVENGEYLFAWIGVIDQDKDKQVSPVASAGHGKEYLDEVKITWGKGKWGKGPVGRAIRSGRASVFQDIQKEQNFHPWLKTARKYGFRSILALPLIVDDQEWGAVAIYAGELEAFDCEEKNLLKEMSEDLSFGLELMQTKRDRNHFYEQKEDALTKLQSTMEGIITTLSKALELRDQYTSGHQQRVTELAVAIASRMDLDPQKKQGLYWAGLIHDLGKVYIPTDILTKSGKLSQPEFEIIKEHPQKAYELLKDVDFPWPLADIVVQHHEKINGSGYPQGLTGNQMFLESKILAVADVVEAMSSHRPYRPALGIDVALEEIKKNKGVLYDEEVVDSCLNLFREGKFIFE